MRLQAYNEFDTDAYITVNFSKFVGTSFFRTFADTEAVARSCSVKKVFFEI